MWTFPHINRSKLVAQTHCIHVLYTIKYVQTKRMNKTQCIGLYPRKPRLHYLVFQNIEHHQPPIHTHMRIFIFGKYLKKLISLLFRILKNILKRGCEHSSIKKKPGSSDAWFLTKKKHPRVIDKRKHLRLFR